MVITTDRPTRIMVKRRYFPNRGKAKDVEGMISEMSKKNIVCDKRIEIHKAIFSPESAGR